MPIDNPKPFSHVRSDSLPSLAQMFSTAKVDPATAGLLRQIRLVVDSNVVLAAIRWMAVERRNRSARVHLQEVVAAGVLVAYAPDYMAEEVTRKLRELAEEWAQPVETLYGLWDEVKSCVTFLPVSEVDAVRAAEEVKLRDPEDASFAALAQQLHADAILTKDKDLGVTDIPTVDDIQILLDLRGYARAKAVELTVIVGGAVVLGVTSAALGGIARALGAFVGLMKTAPTWLWVVLALAGLAVLLHPALRRRATATGQAALERLDKVWRAIKPVVWQLVASAFEEMATARQVADEKTARVSARVPSLCSSAAKA